MNLKSVRILLIGGEDLSLRIPFMQLLNARGVELLALGSQDESAFANSKIAYQRYSLRRSFNPIVDFRSVQEIKAIAVQFKPQVVHAFDTKPAILVPIALPDHASRRCVRTITGLGYLFSGQRLNQRILRGIYIAMQRFSSTRTGMTVFQNSDDLKFFIDRSLVSKQRSALVRGSGVSLEEINSRVNNELVENLRRELKLEGKLVVLMAARINASKGVFEYCMAANKICETRSDVSFLLAGPCESNNADCISVDDLGACCGVVKYLGARSDLATLMAISDIFVLPSYYREGIPRVLLEAASLARALVTTDMPGCREVVEDGNDGLLVAARDVEQLISAVVRLLDNPSERQRFGQRARDKVASEFSLEKVSQQYCDIYQELLAVNASDAHHK